MPRLQIRLLGEFSACSSPRAQIEILLSSRALLGYLIVHRHRHLRRTEVAEILWQERDGNRARRCLSTALWRLRQAVPQFALVQAHGSSETIGLNWSLPGWVDVVTFERKALSGLSVAAADVTSRHLRHLRSAANLYHGDLLPGLDETWIMIERQRLRNLYLDVLMQLAEALAARRDTQPALQYARRLSVLDPLREDVHRLIMRLYIADSNRAKAIEQYRICQGELGSELGVEPMEETRALYREIVGQAQQTGAAPAPAQVRSVAMAMAAEHVDVVRRSLAAADKRLEQTRALINRSLRLA